MMRGTAREAVVIVLLLISATWLIAASGADLALSARFHIGGAWPVGDLPLWQFLYRIDRGPAILLGIAGLGLALYGRINPLWHRWKKQGVFLVLVLLLGPGLLVNSVFKQHWGRPRPREVVELGGTKTFLHPWQKGISGKGRSFPSGHSSAAFYMTVPFFIYRRTNRRRALTWMTGGLIFGLLMSVARIAQGGHFLSDCLWAWGVVHLVALLLAALLKLDVREEPSGSEASPTADLTGTSLPEGYVQLSINGRQAVARNWAAPIICDILAGNTLYQWAQSVVVRDEMHGRGISYGVSLPACGETCPATAAVVRRNRHGGLLRLISGEWFVPPTRAPRELSASIRLTAEGIPTPEVIAYALYPVLGGVFARCDVITRRLPAGADFPEAWRRADAAGRRQMLVAVASLLRLLDRAGAWHQDLNLKNIYITGHGPAMTACLLDVDRVVFSGHAGSGARNYARLARSVRKWRTRWGLDFSEEDLARLADLTREKN